MTAATTRTLPAGQLFSARFFLMCGFTFTVFLSAFMLLPTAPFQILDLGGDTFTAGLFLALLTYASALSAPVTGALSDRLGKRKVLVLTSTLLTFVALYYSVSPSVVWLLALVPIHGVIWSGLLSASASYLVDLLPPERRAEGIAYWGLATVAAIAVAPPLAFWLFPFGWGWLCLGSGLMNLVMACIAFRLKEVPVGTISGNAPSSLVDWRMLGMALTLFLFSFGYGGITSFVALYAQHSGAAGKGTYFIVLALTILLTRPLVGRFADRIGHKRVLLPCLVLTAVGLALLVPGGTRAFLASAVVFGMGFGSSFPVFTAYMMKHVDAARRGAAFGSMLAAFDIGIGTGSMTLGYVIEQHGFATAFALSASLAALSLPYFLLAERIILGSSHAAPASNA